MENIHYAITGPLGNAFVKPSWNRNIIHVFVKEQVAEFMFQDISKFQGVSDSGVIDDHKIFSGYGKTHHEGTVGHLAETLGIFHENDRGVQTERPVEGFLKVFLGVSFERSLWRPARVREEKEHPHHCLLVS
jgi:hypothetical protein